MKPRVFIGSSSENLTVARALQESLSGDVEATVWDQGVFGASRYILESLLDALSDSDFGIFILAADDVVRIRGRQSDLPRDNVVFELGLFIGRLGRNRSFILVPDSAVSQLRLPTDIAGLTYLTYEDSRQDKNYVAAVGTASSRIMRSIREVFAEANKNSQPKLYSFQEFIEIEASAEEEVWILRPSYLLEVDSFYDVVAENLSRSVKYRYFVHPKYNFDQELKLLLLRFARDSRISEDPASLISVKPLDSTDIPITFVFLDPQSSSPRGFAIIDNELRGPSYWIELAKGQTTRFIADNLKNQEKST